MKEVIKLLKEIRRITHTPPTALMHKVHQLSDKALSLLEDKPKCETCGGSKKVRPDKVNLAAMNPDSLVDCPDCKADTAELCVQELVEIAIDHGYCKGEEVANTINAHIEKLTKQIAELQATIKHLRRYAKHKSLCNIYRPGNNDCDCGLQSKKP